MANLKISELAAGTLPMSGAELVPVVQDAATVYVPASALTPADVVRGNDPRLSDSRTPTGSAGGVLSGSYPNPGFAVDMATQAELDAVEAAKVDKVTGKGLSTEDYSTPEKSKLAGIAAGAQVNVATNIAQGTRTTTAVPLTSSTGTGATLDAATASLAGVMAAADKSKLDGIAAGANNYSHPANHLPSIITQDASNRFVTDTEKATWNAKEPAITAGTTAQYRRGDKTWQPVADLPVSTAQAAAIATATAIHPFLLIGA